MDWALPIGVGASILVLGVAAVALRRRRRPYEDDVDFVPPVMVPPARAEAPSPVAARMASMQPPVMAPVMTPITAHPTSVVPAVAPADMQEREALIERMVAATPDAANPFTSRKARRRRARLIMQSMSNAPVARTAPAVSRAETAKPVRTPMVRTLVDA